VNDSFRDSMRVSMPHPRFAFKLPSLFLAALLLFALVSGAGRAAAQSATLAQTEKTATTEPAKTEGGSEAKPSQEEQEHGFLVNGPIVKSIAKATGWSRDVTATIFLWFNFAIIFFGIAIPLSRVLPKIFRKRAETLSHSLVDARKATEDANARLSAVEVRLAGLDEEIAKYRANIEEESKSDEQRIKASIEEEKTRIVASAGQELTAAAAQARRDLRAFATGLAIEQAATQLNLTPETDRALIAEFIGEAARGGKN
jgi:F-type H+-transporting ATPase subunit b